MTSKDTTPPVPDDVAEEYCQPRDYNNVRHWMIVFEDADVKPEIYTDEAAAKAAYDRAQVQWNCSLFAAVPVRAASTPSAEVKPVTEVTVDTFARMMHRCGWDSGNSILDTITFSELIAATYPHGIKIKAGGE